ncbi:MAG: hypothetical protein JO081_18555 [Alphaproteobacteria bacterium]|nr:hypothetical protein [Alphaproteobacteria bacterium]
MSEGEERRGWAAMIFPAGSADVFGAVRGSRQLHWTREAAFKEAEAWVAEMRAGPIRWESVGDGIMIGRIRGYGVVVRSVLLPLGPPPPSVEGESA